MISGGDFITPYLNEIKYFEKPVLFYWLGAFAFKISGINLWAIRSVNAILGLLGCLATYMVGRKLYDRSTGLLASLILGTSVLYFIMSHMVSLDLPVTFFITLCLYGFLLGNLSPPSSARRSYFLIASASAALAVLTKGLIGIVFPILIISTSMIIVPKWRSFRNFYLPSSLLVFLLIALPWHVLVQLRNPEFFLFLHH